jgi:hypothetical protein
MDLLKDDKGKIWAVAGWRMKRQDYAAVAMLQRRGAKPQDKAMLAAKDVEKKKYKDVINEKGLGARVVEKPKHK